MRSECIVGGRGNGTYRTDGTYPASRWVCGLAAAFILGLAGSGRGAQSVAGRLLADATVLSSVDGKLVHVDVNDTWWFEFTARVKGDKYEIPAGTRLRLLPSSTLERLIADVNDRYTPSYRLSAQITRYRGVNFLLATYFLPLSKFKDDGKTEGAEQQMQEATVNLPVDPESGLPPEIVERLKNRRPSPGPLRRPSDANQVSQPVTRDYLGRMLVNRVGLIEAAGQRPGAEGAYSLQPAASSLFIPYALGWNVSDVRYELLPCAALEEVEHVQSRSIEPIRFNVAGLVTQFRGRQHLLLQRAAPVYNYGNFGR